MSECYWKHLNESIQAINLIFEAAGKSKEAEGRNQKKYFYKYEMLPSYYHFSCGRAAEIRGKGFAHGKNKQDRRRKTEVAI
ncbi:hypothetical protein [Microcoleus sp. F4-D5]|uniref:hypothetical protein n=1 Tax=Microcoleus sp. F4-D5 TaxID=2818760 RepID=UPI002FD188EE